MACRKFRGENFHGWLENREICEGFLAQKFFAIRYSIIANRKIGTVIVVLVVFPRPHSDGGKCGRCDGKSCSG